MTTATHQHFSFFDFVRWTAFRLGIYVGTAAIAAVVFLIGAWLYVKLVPAPSLPDHVPITPIEIERPMTPSAPSRGPVVPAGPAEFIAGTSQTGPLTATNIFGAKILASDRTPAGKVIDIVFDRSGRPTGVIVGLEGDWRTKKEILLPFSKVDWKPGDGGTETGIVGMTLRELQNLPLGSHPLLPLKPPPSPPQ